MKLGFYLADVNGEFYGIADHSDLKKAKVHKRILAFFSKKYKSKFMKLLPFESLDDVSEEDRLKLPNYFNNN